MAGLLTCESSSSQQKAGNIASCRKSANFRFRLLQVQLPSFKKVFFVHTKKKIVLVGAVIQRLSEVKRQKVRLGKT